MVKKHQNLQTSIPAVGNRSQASYLLEAERRIELASTEMVTTLNLQALHLGHLPKSLLRLKHIEFLVISGNGLKSLPEWLSMLPKLRGLEVGHNKLKTLPKWLSTIKLQSLHAGGNQLTRLPEWMRGMTTLQALQLDGNLLAEVPEWISSLMELKHLDVRDNLLQSLPKSLRSLKKLSALYLHGNRQLRIPATILGPMWKSMELTAPNFHTEPLPVSPEIILDYYFRSLRGRRRLNEAKLILVGRGGVGKTCLIKQLINGEFNEHEPETPGIEIRPWEITVPDGDNVRLHVWDFGGQEILHATHQFFLTESTLYLLVLSGREGSPTQDAEYWLQLIKSFGGDSRALIALNKSSQHAFDVNRGLLVEKYPFIIGFVTTDCQSGIGVKDLQSLIFYQIGTMEHRKADFPADWFDIKERLAGMTENFLTWDAYQSVCQELGERDTADQRRLAIFLHILGVALNYRDDVRLKDTHVLNPRWVTEGIYSLLRSGQQNQREGVIAQSDVSSVLDKDRYPVSCHKFLLHLMEKFQLCFRLPGLENQYLLPELLGENQPSLKGFFDITGLDFQYQYEILPEGLLPRFIVQTHVHSEAIPHWRWRTGVVLQWGGCHAVVRADGRERRVDIHITGNGPQRRELLAIIREKFNEQHRDLKGLKFEERVPIPKEPSLTVSYLHLLRLEDRDEEWCWPEGSREKVRVKDLLDGIESQEGRIRIRTLLHNDDVHSPLQQNTSNNHKTHATIGIITALEKEFAAMRAVLVDCVEHRVPGPGAGHRYVLGRVESTHGGTHQIALALADMGNNVASARAALLLEHFPAVDSILMVGIAGGVPCPSNANEHVRLGDIVVSNKRGVIQYDMVKLKEIRACPLPPSASLIEAVRLLAADELIGKRPWDKHINSLLTTFKQKRPSITNDKLHAPQDQEIILKHPRDPKRTKGIPRVFQGPVASANELLKDPVKRDALRDKFGIKAVEMEGSGIADATWSIGKGYLVIRGICDYCDQHKNDVWQEYAATVAAGYTRALLESIFAPKGSAI